MRFRHVKPVPLERPLKAQNSESLHRLVASASLEVLARDIVRRPDVLAQVNVGTQVYVPFPPTGRWKETLMACRLLVENGCNPVPHVPARRVRDRHELIEWADSLEVMGIRSVMLIAGDVKDTRARFNDSLEVLETKILVNHGIQRIGIAVYPDGHPYIAKQELEDAFLRKVEIATRDSLTLQVVTQFGFDAKPLLTWLVSATASGLQMPVSVGVAGPTQMKSLLQYATKCGVRHSVKGLFAKPRVLRMLGQWDPTEILSPVAECLSSGSGSQIENAHIFTFGGLRNVLEWREQLLSRCNASVSSNMLE